MKFGLFSRLMVMSLIACLIDWSIDWYCVDGVYATVGWTKYLADGSTKPVEFPDADALVFDVETCLSDGKYATLAAAVSADHWFTWCSSRLVHDTAEPLAPGGRLQLEHLIPLESSAQNNGRLPGRERIILGHNVAFDRSYIKEQYLLEPSKMRFLDTMSLHISLAGFTTAQRAMYMKLAAGKKKDETGADGSTAAAKTKTAVSICVHPVMVFDWLIDWLIGLFVVRSIDWLIHWLIHWLFGWLVGWFVLRSIDRLIDWCECGLL